MRKLTQSLILAAREKVYENCHFTFITHTHTHTHTHTPIHTHTNTHTHTQTQTHTQTHTHTHTHTHTLDVILKSSEQNMFMCVDLINKSLATYYFSVSLTANAA